MGLIDPEPHAEVDHGEEAGMPQGIVVEGAVHPRKPPPEGSAVAFGEEGLVPSQAMKEDELVCWIRAGQLVGVSTKELVESGEQGVSHKRVLHQVSRCLLHLVEPTAAIPRAERK
eukprot:2278486-Lingulodinium_polyedra.AAC.1